MTRINKWIRFYQPFFHSAPEMQRLVECVEAIDDHNDIRHRAKIMLHQTQRLISLADDIDKIRAGKQALQLLFVMICAEHIAKLHDNYTTDGLSRAFTKRFFNIHVSDVDRVTLQHGFISPSNGLLSVDDIVNGLYDVRCDVVHEGKYWNFHFNEDDIPMLNDDYSFIVRISFADLRDIVVRGCINAVRSVYWTPSPSINVK